ncbi:hypothetical protein HYE68_001238 [Fusarium pseudograminearum]|nr:hypothetical protein HYE68_001238 [Fusarium pseudograminearum]
MAPSLDHVFTMRMYTSPAKAVVIPEAKGKNHRIIAFLTHGNIKGSGFEAELQPGGADWILRDPETNTGHLDVRVQFRNSEGHSFYIYFQGVLQIDDKWMEVFTGGPKARTLEFGENYWLSAPVLETSHPDFKWVERSEFVGELRWFIDEDGSVAVENAIYKVLPSIFKCQQGLKSSQKTFAANCLVRLTDDSCALRSTILLAGMHFCFQNGNLGSFESTFLYHKVEVMRYINKWIASNNHKHDTTIFRQMATLAFTEVCTGEVLGAEAHASGLLAIIENAAARDKKENPDISNFKSPEQELANRYFIMAYAYICGLKSLLGGVCRLGGFDNARIEDFSARELVEMSYIWHKGEASQSWALKLQALRLLPFFLTPLPQGATLTYADGREIIQTLREFTTATGIDPSSTCVCTDPPDKIFDNFWRRGPASRLLGECVLAHVETISVKKKRSQGLARPGTSFEGPWCALVTSAIIYGQAILGALEPVDKRMHKYTITLFHHDMLSYLDESRGSTDPGFILWLLIIGLIGCHTYPKGEKDQTPHPSFLFFQMAVRRQAKEMNISSWSEANSILAKVVWPSKNDRFEFVEDLWNEAFSLRSEI